MAEDGGVMEVGCGPVKGVKKWKAGKDKGCRALTQWCSCY